MSIPIDTMSTIDAEPGLSERLARLRGGSGGSCVPEYAGLAEEVRRSPTFPRALQRAKAVADEHRLLALAMLRRRPELCACELQAALGLGHATVSHHMALLVRAGLVSVRRQGKWQYYRLHSDRLGELP